MKHYNNLKPTWLELKKAGLVYYSSTLRRFVISRATFDELLHILRSEFNLIYHLPNDRHQSEITQDEYDNLSQRVTESFSNVIEFITYEEEAREQEIKERILRRLKGK